MNTLLHAIYDDSSRAEQATRKLFGMGIGRDSVLVITAAIANSPEGRAHMGSFAEGETHLHNAERGHVGSFAEGETHLHNAERDHVGSFAESETHMHNADHDRVGSFADSATATPNAAMVGDLVRAGLSQADAQAAAAQLSKGATLVLARVEGDAATQAESILRAAS